MSDTILPNWFRYGFESLNLHVNPVTYNNLKEVLRPLGIGFDVRYLFNKYQAVVSDNVGNCVTTHETMDGAIKHVLSTILSKLKYRHYE